MNAITLERFAALENAALERKAGHILSPKQMVQASAYTERGTTDFVMVLADICSATGILAEAILGPRRYAHTVKARHLLFFHLSKRGHSIAKISRWTNRDKASVRAGIKKFESEMEGA